MAVTSHKRQPVVRRRGWHPRFLLRPRWNKVLADLGGNKTRTLLVVMAIFIGVFAVGMIMSSQDILTNQLRATYAATNPAHFTISIGATGYNTDFTINTASSNTRGFDSDLVEAVAQMPAVATAEGRRVFTAQVQVAPDRRQTIQLTAIDDFADMQVNTIAQVRGSWPPPERAILIERSSMPELPAQVGDTIQVELPDGTRRELPLAGVVHDLHQWPTPFLGTVYGYISRDTLEWLGEPRTFNQMLVRVAQHADSQAHNAAVAQQVYDKIQKAGLDPAFPQVPTPEEPPLEFVITAMTALMSVMSVMAVLLSGFLVVNTIGALLARQTRQIGILKAIGARSSQIVGMYLLLVIGFGLLALVPAVPLAHLATGAFTQEIAGFLNVDVQNRRIPGMIILTQAAMSLAVPLLAALGPILAGTRITVRAALDDQGIAQPGGPQRRSWLAGRGLRFVPRPLLLALRNTVRRRGRLALTLITLTLGGAIFVGVFSVRTSLLGTMDELITRLYNFDAEIYLERTYRADYLVSEAERLPGVVAAEAQIQTSVRRVFPDDAEGLQLQMFAVPPDTQTMLPRVQAGRWLRPEDENALVISTGMQAENPDLQVGSTLTLKIDGRETTWQVVGIMPTFAELRWVYAGYDYYSRVAREVDQSSYIRIVADQHSPAYQAALVNAVEGHFKRQGINVSSTKTMTELSQGDREIIQVLVVSLLFMAFLVALVGGLGLAGTMSLNVIERTREIGIMRAIGASNGAIMQIVLAEGLLIGLLSWGLGTLLALPVSRLLSDGLGELLFADPLAFHFSLTGGLIWLLLSVALALGASLLPARNATRVSVRDVLAYE